MLGFKQFILEGGNITFGKKGDTNAPQAAPFPVTAKTRGHIRDEIHGALASIHDSFHKATGEHLFGKDRQRLHDASAFTGSSHDLMGHHVSHEEFANHKPMVGDVDAQVTKEHKDALATHLQAGQQHGNFTVVGIKKHGDETSVGLKHNDTGHIHQVDFEGVKHPGSESDRFLHSSNWSDTKAGIKGAHHKILINAVGGEKHKFSISHGLRSRTDDSDPGVQHPTDVSKRLFGDQADHSNIHSFQGVTQLIKKHVPAEQHQAIYDKFKSGLAGKKDMDHAPALNHLQKHLGVKDTELSEGIMEAKATPCGRCGTTHVPPSQGGTCPALKKQKTNENFINGKGPGKPGDAARHGLKGKSAAELKSIRSSDSASPRKKQLAHFMLNMTKEETELDEAGLWDNIHAKRKRIKAGSGERMRKPGSEGAPTKQNFRDASVNESYDVSSKHYKALTDLDLNTKNRDMTTKHDGYGPLNPMDKKGSKAFWDEKATMWNTTVEAAMEARCGNCAAFNQAPAIMKKMAEGLGPAGEKIQDLSNLGFCELFEFKCAGTRTCNKWLVNGPIINEGEASFNDEQETTTNYKLAGRKIFNNAGLSDREKTVVARRVVHGHTAGDVAKDMNISRIRVDQIRNKALRRMKVYSSRNKIQRQDIFEEAEQHAHVAFMGASPHTHMGHHIDVVGGMGAGKKFIGLSGKSDVFSDNEREDIANKQSGGTAQFKVEKSAGQTVGRAFDSMKGSGKKILHLHFGHDRKEMAERLKSSIQAGKIPELNGEKPHAVHIHYPSDEDRSHGMSGTKMRTAAENNDVDTYKKHLGNNFSDKEAKSIMGRTRVGLLAGKIKVKR
jgi:hypothetical protein